ncbi:rCG61720, partial [Rattus norvegicus]
MMDCTLEYIRRPLSSLGHKVTSAMTLFLMYLPMFSKRAIIVIIMYRTLNW